MEKMKTPLLKRRELLWRLAQSTLGLSVLGRASQVLATTAQKPTKSIVVLGAGLSGLYSAFLLEAQGFKVTLLEARDRIYFAGEHTAKFSSGMESALESSERVVTELLADIQKYSFS